MQQSCPRLTCELNGRVRAGGQSNMQMGMSDAWEHDMADVTAKATDGALQRIRMLTVDLSAVLQKCPVRTLCAMLLPKLT